MTEKIGEQIKKKKKKKDEQTEKMIEQMQGLPLPGPQIHAVPAPKKKPTGYIADPDNGIDYHWIPELVEIKNDADRLHELRNARDMAATDVRNYGYKAYINCLIRS